MDYELNSEHIGAIANISIILQKAPDTYAEGLVGWECDEVIFDYINNTLGVYETDEEDCIFNTITDMQRLALRGVVLDIGSKELDYGYHE